MNSNDRARLERIHAAILQALHVYDQLAAVADLGVGIRGRAALFQAFRDINDLLGDLPKKDPS